MRVYVDDYKPKKRIIEGNIIEIYPEHEVFYSKEPRWKMRRSEAEAECTTLRNIAVRVGVHVCDFTVEELTTGEFAIVCSSHPEA
jgi:hypothetical protein